MAPSSVPAGRLSRSQIAAGEAAGGEHEQSSAGSGAAGQSGVRGAAAPCSSVLSSSGKHRGQHQEADQLRDRDPRHVGPAAHRHRQQIGEGAGHRAERRGRRIPAMDEAQIAAEHDRGRGDAAGQEQQARGPEHDLGERRRREVGAHREAEDHEGELAQPAGHADPEPAQRGGRDRQHRARDPGRRQAERIEERAARRSDQQGLERAGPPDLGRQPPEPASRSGGWSSADRSSGIAGQDVARPAVEEGLHQIDRIAIEDPVGLARHVADVRRQQEVRRAPQRVILRQRLLVVDVERGARDLALLEGLRSGPPDRRSGRARC